MTPEQLRADLNRALTDRQLLSHPFYRRWEAGELSFAELGAYAAQYRHFEAALPAMLRGMLSGLESGPARDLVSRNLADEESNPRPHLELFAAFADAVGADPTAPMTAATGTLLDVHTELIASSGAEGLAALVAYESQAPAIAAAKAAGLRDRYGLGASATEFWDVHATMDEDHAAWAIEALAGLGPDSPTITAAFRQAADAWWAFLDEREAARPPAHS